MTNFISSVGLRRSRFGQWFLSDSPLPGHLTSITRMTALGTCVDAQVAAGLEHHGAPLVEQALHQRVDLLLQQRLAAGDLDDVAAVGADGPTTSSTLIFRPSWNAYGVSHQEQRRSQAVRRTNTHGRPAWVDSPWIE